MSARARENAFRGGDVENTMRKRPSRISRSMVETESPSIIFEHDEEMDSDQEWSTHLPIDSKGVDKTIIELLNTTWDEERQSKKSAESAVGSTSQSTMTSCVSSFCYRKPVPETKDLRSRSIQSGGKVDLRISKEKAKHKRAHSLKTNFDTNRMDHHNKNKENKSVARLHGLMLSKPQTEKMQMQAEPNEKFSKNCKSITDNSIVKFLERQKRASNKSEEISPKTREKQTNSGYVPKYLTPKATNSGSDTSLIYEQISSPLLPSERLLSAESPRRQLSARNTLSTSGRRENDTEVRLTRSSKAAHDFESARRPNTKKIPYKIPISANTKCLQISETSSYAISMDKLHADRTFSSSSPRQGDRNRANASKLSPSERAINLSFTNSLRQREGNQHLKPAKRARFEDVSDERSDDGSTRHRINSLRCEKPMILSCCSSGRIPTLVVVHCSSERLDVNRKPLRNLNERVHSSATLERLENRRRFSPSEEKLHSNLHSSSTTERLKNKPFLDTLAEDSIPQLYQGYNSMDDPRFYTTSTDHPQYQLRCSSTTDRFKNHHRLSPSTEEFHGKIHSSSTTDRFQYKDSSQNSNEAIYPKLHSSIASDQLRFPITSTITTEQLKAKLHSNSMVEGPKRNPRGLPCSSTEDLEVTEKSSQLSNAESEEYATCASTEQLKDKQHRSDSKTSDDGSKRHAFYPTTEKIIENRLSTSKTSSRMKNKRQSCTSADQPKRNVRSISKLTNRLTGKQTYCTSKEKLKSNLRSSSKTSNRNKFKHISSSVPKEQEDTKRHRTETPECFQDEPNSCLSSGQLKRKLRPSSSTEFQQNTSNEKLNGVIKCRSSSEKQMHFNQIGQTKSQIRSRISPRWQSENSSTSAQVRSRWNHGSGGSNTSEGMIMAKSANLNVLWSKDGPDSGDGAAQRKKIRHYLGIEYDHKSRGAPAKPKVEIVKEMDHGVQTHYAITETVIRVPLWSRVSDGPREKEVQTTATLDSLIEEIKPPKEKELLLRTSILNLLWRWSLLIWSLLCCRILAPIANCCALLISRFTVPMAWVAVGIGCTVVLQYMADNARQAAAHRKHTLGSLRLVSDASLLMSYVYRSVDYIFGGFLRTPNHRYRSS